MACINHCTKQACKIERYLHGVELYCIVLQGIEFYREVFICTAVQIILRLFAQQASSVLCRASFTLSHRLPLFVYTLPFTVLLLAAAHAMYTVEDEGETNTNSLELNDEFEVI